VAKTVKVVDGPSSEAVAFRDVPGVEVNSLNLEMPVERETGAFVTLEPLFALTEVELVARVDILVVTGTNEDELEKVEVETKVESEALASSAIYC
jgi:hypothetical protein